MGSLSCKPQLAGFVECEAELSLRRLCYREEAFQLLPELRSLAVIASNTAVINKSILNDPTLLHCLHNVLNGSISLADLQSRLTVIHRHYQSLLFEPIPCFEPGKETKKKKKNRHSAIVSAELEACSITGSFKLDHEDQRASSTSLLNELSLRSRKLDIKLKWLKRWRKLSGVACEMIFAAALVCSVVLASFAAPHVAVAIAAVGPVAVKSVEQWVDSMWERREGSAGEKREVVEKMRTRTSSVAREMERVQVLLGKMVSEMGLISFALEGKVSRPRGPKRPE